MSKVRFVGLDVHADTIAVAVAEPGGEVRSHGVIPNRLESVRKLVGKLGPVKEIRACYEAGPTGYVLYWQLTRLAVVFLLTMPLGADDSQLHANALRDALKLREQGSSQEAGVALERLASESDVHPAMAARIQNALGLIRRDQGRWP